MQNQEFKFNPSRVYAVFWTGFCLASAGLCMTLHLSLAAQLAGVFIILAYGFIILRRYALLQSPSSIISLRFKGQQTWMITLKNETVAAELQGSSIVTNKIVILNFKRPEKRFPLPAIILRDSLPPDKYRQLLVLLKMN